MRPALFSLCLCLAAVLPLTGASAKASAQKPALAKAAKVKALDAKTKSGPFNPANPADIVTLLSTMGAKATQAKSEDGMVFLDVTAPGTSFGVQMKGCDPNGTACHAMALFTVFDKTGITLAQLNDFNRSQFACRGLQTPDGQPSVMYAALVDGHMTQDQTKAHFGVWQGCLKGFGEFVGDPVGFLSKPHS